MMTFSQYPYSRPDFASFAVEFTELVNQFRTAETSEAQLEIMQRLYELRRQFDTARDIARVRFTADTTDAFYKGENQYFDEKMPEYEGLISDFYKALIGSEFKGEIVAKYGQHLINLATLSVKTHSSEVVEELKSENLIGSEYVELLASAEIPFEGETYNLSGLGPFMVDQDRVRRKSAHEARWKFMASQADKLDDQFDRLVKTRHSIAQKLGYENFVQLGYDRMLRTDYGPAEVGAFRKHIQEYFVPLASELRKEQAQRLGLPELAYYDESLTFPDGNAQPKGNPQWIVDQGGKLYQELSPSTGEFYEFMTNGELLDLEARKGKAGGGYCTFIADYKAPFIFANFNGTEGDVFVLTHELGHAYQCYMSRNQSLLEYNWPTYEACEIHSMSMEYLTWPWMELFFEQDAHKYRYGHLLSSTLFLPYGTAVDEFQHFVYSHPEASPADRHAAWREIEQRYLPTRDYSENEYLSKGRFWQIQRHIYLMPFYYIDYVLAQICAFQFWEMSMTNREETFNTYVELCKQGGSKPFLELVKHTGLASPFEASTISQVTDHIRKYLSTVNVAELSKSVS
ncbi:MAG: M3 family oligoendopeptidase [Bacteroidota bacterium]